ncbi:hypothetical protein [Kytococcus sp. Marseille-QA3725]
MVDGRPEPPEYRGPWVGDDEPEDEWAKEAWRGGSSRGADLGAAVLGTLLTGILVFAGLGWLVVELTGLDWLMPFVILLGVGVSLFTLILRYGDA